MSKADLSLTVVVGALCCVSHAAAQDDGGGVDTGWTSAEVAEVLRQSNVCAGEGNYRTRFEHKAFMPKTERDPGKWADQDVALLEEIQHFVCDDMLRVAHWNKASRYERICVWRDGAWDQRVTGDQGRVAVTGAAAPGDLHNQGFLFNLSEGRIPAWNTLAELAEAGEVISSTRTGNVLSHRFANVDVPHHRLQYELKLDVSDAPRLLAFSIDLSDADASLTTRQAYTVSEWKRYGNVLLPTYATLDIWRNDSPNPDIAPPIVSRSEYRRLTFESIDDPCSDHEELFAVSYPVGTRVHDDRMNIGYEIGDSYIYMDGVMYILAEPLMEPPGDRLDALLASARVQKAPPAGTGGDNEPIGQSSSTNSASDLSDGAVITVCIAGVLVIAGLCVVGRSLFASRFGGKEA